jgi:hypothetical protein
MKRSGLFLSRAILSDAGHGRWRFVAETKFAEACSDALDEGRRKELTVE